MKFKNIPDGTRYASYTLADKDVEIREVYYRNLSNDA